MRAKLSSPNTFRSEGLFATNLGENWLNCVCFLAEYIFCFMFSGMKHIACQRDPFGYCLGSQCCPIYHHGELSRSPLPANVRNPFPFAQRKEIGKSAKENTFLSNPGRIQLRGFLTASSCAQEGRLGSKRVFVIAI